jgi:hypothetical protein
VIEVFLELSFGMRILVLNLGRKSGGCLEAQGAEDGTKAALRQPLIVAISFLSHCNKAGNFIFCIIYIESMSLTAG